MSYMVKRFKEHAPIFYLSTNCTLISLYSHILCISQYCYPSFCHPSYNALIFLIFTLMSHGNNKLGIKT